MARGVSKADRYTSFESGPMKGLHPELGIDTYEWFAAFEFLRQYGVQLDDWVTNEITENNFGNKLTAGLESNGIHGEAAHAVVREMERLMKLVGSTGRDLAVQAKLLAQKLDALYVEPIKENQARRNRSDSSGLKVN